VAVIGRNMKGRVEPAGSELPARERTFPLAYGKDASDTRGGAFPGGQTFGFQGAWTDPVTGLAYHRARWYDPRNATWLSEDPLQDIDSPNLYAFVRHNPVNAVDATGRATDWAFGPFGPAFDKGFAAQAKEVAARAPRPETPEQRAVEMGFLLGPLVVGVTVGALAVAGEAALVAGLVSGTIAVVASTPTLTDPSLPADTRTALGLTTFTVGSLTGRAIPATNPTLTALGAAGGSALVQGIAIGEVNASSLAVTGLGGYTGGLVACQWSAEFVKKRAALTGITSTLQAVFDYIKQEVEKKNSNASKHLVNVTEGTNPVAPEGPR